MSGGVRSVAWTNEQHDGLRAHCYDVEMHRHAAAKTWLLLALGLGGSSCMTSQHHTRAEAILPPVELTAESIRAEPVQRRRRRLMVFGDLDGNASGSIDDLQIYSRARSASEVTGLCRAVGGDRASSTEDLQCHRHGPRARVRDDYPDDTQVVDSSLVTSPRSLVNIYLSRQGLLLPRRSPEAPGGLAVSADSTSRTPYVVLVLSSRTTRSRTTRTSSASSPTSCSINRHSGRLLTGRRSVAG
jgi:hypothetical protein